MYLFYPNILMIPCCSSGSTEDNVQLNKQDLEEVLDQRKIGVLILVKSFLSYS